MSTSNSPQELNTHHQRVLPFRKVANFRDLGGYPAAEEYRVKWGCLYRSGHLADMNRADLRRFKALNIGTVIDLRSMQEQEKDPDRLPAGIKALSLPMLDVANEAMSKEVHAAVENKDYKTFDPGRKMMRMYQLLSMEHTAEYQQFVQAILAAEGKPVLWHCTAGKDRTGFGAAIILRLLGVADETIIDDYLLSRKYVDQLRGLKFFLRISRGKEAVEIVRKLLLVDQSWIQAAFDAIDLHWGDFDHYVTEALSLTAADIFQLRATLLDGNI